MRRLLLLLLFLAAPAGAAITFNAGAPMTLAASYAGSARPYGGGIILHVGGTFDGANVALQVSGGAGWITADTCDTMTVAQVCRAAVGPVDLRLTITGPGAGTSITAVGFEVQAVVASTGGTGSVTFDLVGPGANTGALTIDTGGTLAATGTGAITATAMDAGGLTGEITANGTLIEWDPADDGTNLNLSESYLTFGATAMSGTSGLGIFASGGELFFTNSGPTGWRYKVSSNRLATRGGIGGASVFLDACVASSPCYSFDSDSDTGAYRDATSGGVALADEGNAIATALFSTQARLIISNTLQMTPIGTAPTLAAGERGLAWATSDNDLCKWDGSSWTKVVDGTACTF